MGCCQNREDAKTAFHRQRHNKSLSIDLLQETLDPDWLVPSEPQTPTSASFHSDTSRTLLFYAQTCNSKKRWEMLAPLIANSTEVSETNVSLPWSEKPRTIGSVALIYLGAAVKKYTTQVSPYIEVFLPVLIAYLKSGSMDQKENTIFLLYNLTDCASEKALNKLISSKALNYLSKWMLSPKSELRRYAANLCYKLYKDRPDAKKEFIKSDGAFYLVQLIGWHSSSDLLDDLIRDLKEIVMDKGEEVVIENLNATKEPLTLEILKRIDLSTRKLELRDEVEKLIKFYQSLVGESSPLSA